jgi:hypothetical protein
LADACGTVKVRDNEHHAAFMAESVYDFVAFAHGGQDVLGRPSKFVWQTVGDIHAHSQVAWEGLSVPEISSVVHGTLWGSGAHNGHSPRRTEGFDILLFFFN